VEFDEYVEFGPVGMVKDKYLIPKCNTCVDSDYNPYGKIKAVEVMTDVNGELSVEFQQDFSQLYPFRCDSCKQLFLLKQREIEEEWKRI